MKMRQAGVCACLIVRCLCLVVELQRQLNASWWLGARNLSHGSSQAHVWSVELRMVKGVDKVGPELQPNPLGNQEVFVQTQVHIGVVRSAKSSQLWGAIAERSSRRGSEIAVVVKPLDTASRTCDRRLCPERAGSELQSAREPRENVPDSSPAP